MSIDSPEIVNGLQTSPEIFTFFNENKDKSDDRHVLIRVVLPPDELTRNKITKATNLQTPVAALSLRATDQIHFDIEERLRLYGLFYDRRKGQYRNQRKPISQIVTIKGLAQSVLAVLLLRPNDAYGGPLKVLKQEDSYNRIFSEKYDRDLYVSCSLLDKRVADFIGGVAGLSREERRGLKYYIMTWLARKMSKKKNPTPADITKLKGAVVMGISDIEIADATNAVLKLYKANGGNDKTAKGPSFRQVLLDAQPGLA